MFASPEIIKFMPLGWVVDNALKDQKFFEVCCYKNLDQYWLECVRNCYDSKDDFQFKVFNGMPIFQQFLAEYHYARALGVTLVSEQNHNLTLAKKWGCFRAAFLISAEVSKTKDSFFKFFATPQSILDFVRCEPHNYGVLGDLLAVNLLINWGSLDYGCKDAAQSSISLRVAYEILLQVEKKLNARTYDPAYLYNETSGTSDISQFFPSDGHVQRTKDLLAGKLGDAVKIRLPSSLFGAANELESAAEVASSHIAHARFV